jgi:hypothetical protein
MFKVSTDSSLQIVDPFSGNSVTLRCTGKYLLYGHCPEPHTLQYRHTVRYRTSYLSSNACDLYSAAISAAECTPSESVRLSWFTQALDFFFFILMHVPCIFCFYYNRPMHNCISQQYVFILYTSILLLASKFPCHHHGVLHLCLAKLHKFLKLKLLKLQFHKFNKMY